MDIYIICDKDDIYYNQYYEKIKHDFKYLSDLNLTLPIDSLLIFNVDDLRLILPIMNIAKSIRYNMVICCDYITEIFKMEMFDNGIHVLSRDREDFFNILNIFIGYTLSGENTYISLMNKSRFDKILRSLSKMERLILLSFVDGMNRSQIAETNHISEDTVCTHVKNIKKKLESNELKEIIKFARKMNPYIKYDNLSR